MSVVEVQSKSEVVELPDVFVQWQCDERKRVYDGLLKKEMPKFWGAHLPVLSTLNDLRSAHPIRLSNKGVGLLPRQEHLDAYLDEIAVCLSACEGRPPNETRTERVVVARKLYENPEHIERTTLGTIEIFLGQTYKNLGKDPRCCLLFTGGGPRYPSYEFSCRAEIVLETEKRFRFIKGMRLLFEMERFHIQQPQFLLGYVFHVGRNADKTPHRVQPRASGCPFHSRAPANTSDIRSS